MLTKNCPERIIFSTTKIENEERLFKSKSEQISVEEKSLSLIKGKGYVIFDFGKEMCGGVRLLLNQTRNCKAKITFGESVGEVVAEYGYKNAVCAHSIRTFEITLPDYSSIAVGETGFRFVKLELLDDESVLLKSIYAENKIFKAKHIWEYTGNDERLKEIYLVAKRTVNLCASGKYVWDGIKRDRLVWAGDLYSEMLALVSMYGRVKKIEDTLDFSRKNSPLPCWMNNIPSYSVWWLITLFDYCDIVKNTEFLKKNYPYVEKLLVQLLDSVDENGEFNFSNCFIDLDLHDSPYTECGVRALFYIALNSIEKSQIVTQESLNIISILREKLDKKPILCGEERSVVALKYRAGKKLIKDEENILIKQGLNQSTFMSYFVFDAVYSIFGKECAEKAIKDYFGKMLDLGATTFFETFSPEWAENSIRLDQMPVYGKKDFHGDYGRYCYKGYRMSLCHGWSSGVIRLIRRMSEKNFI